MVSASFRAPAWVVWWDLTRSSTLIQQGQSAHLWQIFSVINRLLEMDGFVLFAPGGDGGGYCRLSPLTFANFSRCIHASCDIIDSVVRWRNSDRLFEDIFVRIAIVFAPTIDVYRLHTRGVKGITCYGEGIVTAQRRCHQAPRDRDVVMVDEAILHSLNPPVSSLISLLRNHPFVVLDSGR
ncbi:hypothetical protein [Thermogutta sp.]|uniref:hypothetical protein n=1 Tax=Thermogutta sp. TaxID=1962930 RepID=UPI00321F934D